MQSLIDSRLDTIDRMLLGRLPRGERLEVVREVESQIFELLRERGGAGEVTRDDVIDALRRLDPPEAYLPRITARRIGRGCARTRAARASDSRARPPRRGRRCRSA
ncbi:MAG: hypothetical protein U0790_08995 [Isosphaeraceae bacterium]